MRVSKRDKTWLASAGTLGMSFTGVTKERTYYDGQMPVEETVHLDSTLQKLTRNFVGARGIEMMETTAGGNTTQAYPLYDTHGNMVATLSKNSAGTSWSLGNERSYDVWGSVRSGAATGGPKGRYVANLGHVADDESGLIYMRARYYEPESGRFVSEDRAHQGINWYGYCGNDPVNRVDESGNNWRRVTCGTLVSLGILALLAAIGIGALPDPTQVTTAAIAAALTFAVVCFAVGFAVTDLGMTATSGLLVEIASGAIALFGAIVAVASALANAELAGMAMAAVVLTSVHAVVLMSLCINAMMEPFDQGFNSGWE